VKQTSKSQKELKPMNVYLMKETQTNPMRKKQTSLRNLRKDLAKTNGNYLSNASTVEKLNTFLPNVLIPRKKIVMVKKLTIRKNIKRVNANTKRNSIRKRKKYILKKVVAHLT
jgi:hypothetical protein